MSKVGILTFHGVPNVGAYLQCASLVSAVRKLGHEVEVVDYAPAAQRELFRPQSTSDLVKVLSHPRRIVGGLRSFWDRRQHLRTAQQDITRLPLGDWIAEATALSNLEYDRVILGSDEIWNLDNPIMDQDMAYAGLHFRSEQLCSYAPSFGSVSETSDVPPEMRHALARISHLSARDRNSVDLLAKLGLKAKLTVDPTLLERRVPLNGLRGKTSKQIVIYGAPIGDEYLKVLEQIADRQGLELCSIIYPQSSNIAHTPGVNASEFLRVFRDARAVVTTAFHGTIFAVLAGKPFAVVNPGQKLHKIIGLLEMLDAENRLISDLEKLEDLLSEPLDAEAVNSQLEAASVQSLEFLQNALA